MAAGRSPTRSVDPPCPPSAAGWRGWRSLPRTVPAQPGRGSNAGYSMRATAGFPLNGAAGGVLQPDFDGLPGVRGARDFGEHSARAVGHLHHDREGGVGWHVGAYADLDAPVVDVQVRRL